MDQAALSLAGIVLAGVACQWLAWWSKLPAILFLLLTGLLLGPISGWLQPDALFGNLLFPSVSLAVSIVLFEGSLTLRLREIRGLERVVRNMVTHGLLVAWMVTAVATRLFTGLEWALAILFGALVVVTGPTVVIPLLRTIRPTPRIAEVLRWEGIVIDPIGALLAVLVYEFLLARADGGEGLLRAAGIFFKAILAGTLAGGAAAEALARLLRSHWMPDYLRDATALALVFAAFISANLLQAESGLLSVTVMGMWLANRKQVPLQDVLHFKETLSMLLISVLFIVLGARVDFADLRHVGFGALGVFLAIQLVARPLKVWISTWGSGLSRQEKLLLAWVGPRGIVAAAVSAIIAPRLVDAGYEQAALLVPLTFAVIVATVLLQCVTAGPLARKLGVSEPEPRGVLIAGANIVARAVAKSLSSAGFRVVLADSTWDNCAQARMDGLAAFYVDPVSEQADRRLDLVGLGCLLAMMPRHEVNALAAMRYRGEFGRNAVFRLSGANDNDRVAGVGRTLFDVEATFSKLTSLLATGGEIRATRLSEEYDWRRFLEMSRGSVSLFAVDKREQLRIFTTGESIEPQAGWTIYALRPGPAKSLSAQPA